MMFFYSPKKSHSLEGEDLLIDRFFNYQSSGLYIDIGANHPVKYNNTYLFYRRGWRGINVDADKKIVAMLKKFRPKDTNLYSSVGNSRKPRKFYEFYEPALNTHSTKLAKSYEAAGYGLKRVEIRSAIKLSAILRKHLHPSSTIDFINLDVEGDELSVLKSNEWSKYRPRLWVIEDLNSKSLPMAISSPITKFMKSVNYTLAMKTFTNLFFTDSTHS